MTYLRSLTALSLALMLALTAVAMDLGRGYAMRADQVVICTDAGPVVVGIDQDGQPLHADHHCPYCALSQVALQAVPNRAAPHALRVAPVRWTLAAQREPPAGVRIISARGPPQRLI
jgi:hypothetical protein